MNKRRFGKINFKTKYEVNYLLNKFMIVLMLLYVFIPPYLNYVLKGHYLLKRSLMMLFIIIMALILLGHKVRIDKYLIYIIMSYTISIISTILNEGKIYDSFVNFILVILLCLFFGIASNNDELSTLVLYSIRDISFVIFFINTIISIIMPNGIPSISSSSAPGFLYGNVNSNFKYIMYGLLCSFLIDKRRNITVSFITLFFYVGTLYTFFNIYHTMTALLGLLIITLWNFFRKRIEKNLFIILSFVIIFILIFNFIIVINTDLSISKMFIRLFGKDETLSNRTLLWSKALESISKRKFIGYGVQDEQFIWENIGNYFGSHNYYLDLFFSRGFIGFVFIFILVFSINRNIYKLKTPTYFEYIALGFCVAYLFMFLFEPFDNCDRFFIPLFYILSRETYKSKDKQLKGKCK